MITKTKALQQEFKTLEALIAAYSNLDASEGAQQYVENALEYEIAIVAFLAACYQNNRIRFDDTTPDPDETAH